MSTRIRGANVLIGKSLLLVLLQTVGGVRTLANHQRGAELVCVDRSARPPTPGTPGGPPPRQDQLDTLLDGIDKSDVARRYERWLAIDRLYQSANHAAMRSTIVRIATGEIRMTRYQRFIAAANVAGLGFPTTCGPPPPMNTPLGAYLHWLQRSPVRQRTYRIAWDPVLSTLALAPRGVAHGKCTIQDCLWNILTTRRLDFRILPECTLYIFLPGPDV
jgi:hypothetical protein